MTEGLIHLYTGDGKGKTTAAVGLAVRALGSGMSVTFVQFLKNGKSSELDNLRKLGASVYSGDSTIRFLSQMNTAEKDSVRDLHDRNLRDALSHPCDLLVLDEACAAYNAGVLDPVLLQEAVIKKPSAREVVLTGRNPAQWMIDCADYISEIHCVRHPYEKGVSARKGVEF